MMDDRNRKVAGMSKRQGDAPKYGVIYALTPESSEKGRVIYNAISGVKIE